MSAQSVKNQRGEIEFRKKLYLQQVEGQRIFDDEFDSAGAETILKDRMSKTLAQMVQLRDRRISLSPYIEIGAERCQRSLVMENDLGASGAAVDISFDLLKSCRYYQKVFSKTKAPTRVCCDANNLPFMTGSIPFIFCYETLHHFPEPTPIVEELHRVLLPGGYFFFDEEPYRKILRFSLYKAPKIYSSQSLHRSVIRKTVDRLFSAQVCNEVEHGVIENHDIPVAQWRKALESFSTKDVNLKPLDHSPMQSSLFGHRSYLKDLLAHLLGGTVSGICQKSSVGIGKQLSISGALICPSCKQSGSEFPLNRVDSSFRCSSCSKAYPIVDDVVFLFAHDKFAELYPEVFRFCVSG
ncbi:MAG: class I SAM-dependent methyltransferase [Terriglobales bacterium]|jgi:SAM-dependent methyltransferase